ncbi:NAD(P)-dependent dehydrogenase (short-subunit alcohol dehydrogenase family) [Pararhizobium capsulatum DSM 1112]|uniref:NAD(P)-dependent dehydrogenase (Short-subunit alcohol dehydrogenase family) n=1 Tax=Pararhizobium capsulatum DSM 1112 TaxID=1121113 RepID=A0ABU0BVH0_9HYPH|nr:3-ketoacyl-ACP reductase [Pararhizobium capsulatum]MDQ0321455.1 NAD(P)-dependent dehydrogenase (short-subunit alcohol dehydrogenase family) [Pararhizobium capsulatum DSM 1112]
MTARRVAIVTGGRRGIGLGIARALAVEGFDIAITGIGDSAGISTVIDELAALGAEAAFFQADLSDIAGHQATVDSVIARFGRIDCLVNNAGMASVVRGDFLDMQPENFDTIVSTNLRGTVFFTQAVLRAMLSSDGKGARSIVNITSVSSSLSSPERLDYCISKAGLSAFSQGLALRLADTGIGVFEVRPGIIRSEMTAGVSTKYDALIDGGLVPMKRWGEPSDIGDIVSALASGRFGFATGSVINADGALSIGKL